MVFTVRRSLLLSVVLCFCLNFIQAGVQKATAASMFRSDAQRTGHYSTKGVHEKPDIKWKFQADSVAQNPIIADGMVCFGTKDGFIYALDYKTGKQEWIDRIRISGAVTAGVVGTMAADENSVYFGTIAGSIYALKASTGGEIWQRKNRGVCVWAPVIIGDSLYAVRLKKNNVYVHALNINNGSPKWNLQEEGIFINSTISASPDIVYVFVARQRKIHLYALDAETGNSRWRLEEDFSILQSYVVVVGEKSFWKAGEHLYALDPETGAKGWSVDSVTGSYPALADGAIYVGIDNKMSALDAKTGRKKWTFENAQPAAASPAVADGVIYFHAKDNYLYALDATSGKQKWKFEAPEYISGLSVCEGVIYFASEQYIYALE